MKILGISFYVTLLLFSSAALSQKLIEIPSNKLDSSHWEFIRSNLATYGLDDLTNSQDSIRLRIWFGQEIVELGTDLISARLVLSIQPSNFEQPKIIKTIEYDSMVAKRLIESMLRKEIFDLPDEDFIGIDGQHFLFEISTSQKYRLFSYWSPSANRNKDAKTIRDILSIVSSELDFEKQRQDFMDELEPGLYHLGMSTIRIDNFLSSDVASSTLYKYVEGEIRERLKIDEETRRSDFPQLFINEKPAFLKDLNSYEYSKKTEVVILLRNEATTLYGTAGANGAVLVKVK